MLLQFVQALTGNIQALTNSSVAVSVNRITPGANASTVVVGTSVVFLDMQTSSVQIYISALSSNPAAVYGPDFPDVKVDLASIAVLQQHAAGKLTADAPKKQAFWSRSKLAAVLTVLPSDRMCFADVSLKPFSLRLLSASCSLTGALFLLELTRLTCQGSQQRCKLKPWQGQSCLGYQHSNIRQWP